MNGPQVDSGKISVSVKSYPSEVKMMTAPGAESMARELQEDLAEAGVIITIEVAMQAALIHFSEGKAATAEYLISTGVPMVTKNGGKFGSAGTKCTTYSVNGVTILMG